MSLSQVITNITTAFPTTTYTALLTDTSLVCTSSAPYTITLPSAVGTGQILRIKKVSNDLNTITIQTVLSQQIDAVLGGTSTTINTIGECLTLMSDQSNWQIVERRTKTPRVAFTPGLAASFGSPSVNIAYSWRDGADLVMIGHIAVGAPTAAGSNFTFGFQGAAAPAGLGINTTIIPSVANQNQDQPVGTWSATNTGNSWGYIIAAPGVLGTNQLAFSLGGQNLVINNTSTLGGSGNILMWNARVPISGWND